MSLPPHSTTTLEPSTRTWWVPLVGIGGGEGALGQGAQRVLDDAREAGLHEGVDRQVVHPVLVDELHRHLFLVLLVWMID